MKIAIGIDNGVTGTIGMITPFQSRMFKTPVFKEQSYTKKKQNISRVDVEELESIFIMYLPYIPKEDIFVLIERPMINSARFKASMSAIRALESTLIVIERLGYGYEYTDSKLFQKALLPIGTKGTSELKKASMDIGIRKYPHLKEIITKHGDADGLLIADYLMYHKRV